MSTRPEQKQPASGLESEVMSLLWQAGPLSTPEVHRQVGEPRNLAYTTILTVLHRLLHKGLVTRSSGGRSHVYAPSTSLADRQAEAARTMAASLAELGEVGIAAFLAEAGRLDPKLVEALRLRLEDGR